MRAIERHELKHIKNYLGGLNVVNLPGSHFPLGIDVDSDRLVVVIGIHNLDNVRPGGQPGYGERAILTQKSTPGKVLY